MISEILKSFILLFIIIDPFVSSIFFVSQFKKASVPEKRKAAWTAILVAGILLFIFLFSGMFLLDTLGISFSGFQVAGGVILLIMGVTAVLGISLGNSKKDKISSSAILIGTPLLSGPGALTTIIVLSKEYGLLIPGIASLMVLIVSFFMLRYAHLLERMMSTEVIEICSKVLSLLLAALAVDFIYSGVTGFMTGG